MIAATCFGLSSWPSQRLFIHSPYLRYRKPDSGTNSCEGRRITGVCKQNIVRVLAGNNLNYIYI